MLANNTVLMFLKVENVFVLLLSSPNKLSRSTQKLFVQKLSRVMIGNFSSRRVRFSRVYFKGLDVLKKIVSRVTLKNNMLENN